MSLISIIVAIALVGLLVWAIVTLVPMPEPFKKAIYVISVVVLAIYALQTLGLLGDISAVRIR